MLNRDTLAREAKEIIERIAAHPRAPGSEHEARARRYCAEYLSGAGFSVSEEDFDYSPLPGKWAVPAIGALSLGWFAALGASLDRSAPQQAVHGALPLLVVMGLVSLLANRAIRRPRRFLSRATNLVATRGGAPRVWLMAHLDSKSQKVPMLVRIAGIAVASAAIVTTLIASFIPGARDLGNGFWIPATVAGAAGSIAVLLSTVGNRSRGAIDNASGVAAAMLTAVGSAPGSGVGVLVTSAEELGLAGAWAWVRQHAERYVSPEGRAAVNFDGLDDVGSLICMSDARSRVAASLRTAATATRRPVVFRGVLPGIMVDANALNHTGWDAITISKGNFSTLARIHTSADAPERLTGTGVAEAVELVRDFINRGN